MPVVIHTALFSSFLRVNIILVSLQYYKPEYKDEI